MKKSELFRVLDEMEDNPHEYGVYHAVMKSLALSKDQDFDHAIFLAKKTLAESTKRCSYGLIALSELALAAAHLRNEDTSDKFFNEAVKLVGKARMTVQKSTVPGYLGLVLANCCYLYAEAGDYELAEEVGSKAVSRLYQDSIKYGLLSDEEEEYVWSKKRAMREIAGVNYILGGIRLDEGNIEEGLKYLKKALKELEGINEKYTYLYEQIMTTWEYYQEYDNPSNYSPYSQIIDNHTKSLLDQHQEYLDAKYPKRSWKNPEVKPEPFVPDLVTVKPKPRYLDYKISNYEIFEPRNKKMSVLKMGLPEEQVHIQKVQSRGLQDSVFKENLSKYIQHPKKPPIPDFVDSYATHLAEVDTTRRLDKGVSLGIRSNNNAKEAKQPQNGSTTHSQNPSLNASIYSSERPYDIYEDKIALSRFQSLEGGLNRAVERQQKAREEAERIEQQKSIKNRRKRW